MIAKLVESDINAHIVDIECKVIPENNSCEISFSNLHFGVISAVKFIAQGFNVFGDCVLVNGKEEFPLVLQDIKVEKNARLENYRVKLPDSNMRKLKLRESQICYDDGTVATYTESNIIKYTVQEYQNSDLSDDIRAARKAHYKVDFKNKPVLLDSGWVCGCGRFNPIDQQECSLCGLLKVNVLRLLDEGYDDILLDAYLKKKSKQDALEIEQRKKAKANKKKKIILICAVSIVLAFLVTLGVYMHIMSGRSTFDSVEDMKAAVKGSYIHYDDRGIIDKQLIFSDDECKIIHYFNILDDTVKNEITIPIINWNYKSGKVGSYIVLADGNIKYGNDILTRGDYVEPKTASTAKPSSSSSTSTSYSTTTGEKNALRSAKSYLNSSAFSYEGLIKQLEFEGYSHKEAIYGADNCGANWKEQAARSAKSYLQSSSFSRQGLIEQLEFEGFTHSQAVYGVEQNGY